MLPPPTRDFQHPASQRPAADKRTAPRRRQRPAADKRTAPRRRQRPDAGGQRTRANQSINQSKACEARRQPAGASSTHLAHGQAVAGDDGGGVDLLAHKLVGAAQQLRGHDDHAGGAVAHLGGEGGDARGRGGWGQVERAIFGLFFAGGWGGARGGGGCFWFGGGGGGAAPVERSGGCCAVAPPVHRTRTAQRGGGCSINAPAAAGRRCPMPHGQLLCARPASTHLLVLQLRQLNKDLWLCRQGGRGGGESRQIRYNILQAGTPVGRPASVPQAATCPNGPAPWDSSSRRLPLPAAPARRTFAAGCSTSSSFRMVAPSLVMVTSPMSSTSICNGCKNALVTAAAAAAAAANALRTAR